MSLEKNFFSFLYTIWKHDILRNNFIFKRLYSHFIILPYIKVTKGITCPYCSMVYVVEYLPGHMKFLSCGTTFQNSAEFTGLISSFDIYCWQAIAIVLFLCVPVFLSFLNCEYLSCNRVLLILDAELAVLANLLEQSTPYSSSLLNKKRMKLVVCGILLCVLVLSNAYKNDNMYEMISPKKFRPFLKFDQLLNANYSIFTEARKNKTFGQLYIYMSDVHACFSNGYDENMWYVT